MQYNKLVVDKFQRKIVFKHFEKADLVKMH